MGNNSYGLGGKESLIRDSASVGINGSDDYAIAWRHRMRRQLMTSYTVPLSLWSAHAVAFAANISIMQWQKQLRQKKHQGSKPKKTNKGNLLKCRSMYLVKGEYPAGSSKSEKLVVRRRAKYYQIVDGQLHYVGHLKGTKLEEDPTKRVCSCSASLRPGSGSR